MKLRALTVLTFVLLIAVASTGCGRETASTVETQQLATATVESTAQPPADIPPSATSGSAGLDAAGVDTELNAMERELDSLDMPSDADFNDVEGALY